MVAHCDDTNHAPETYRVIKRHDTPKSGSRREAIAVLTKAAQYHAAQLLADNTANAGAADAIQAALNYMILHDGW